MEQEIEFNPTRPQRLLHGIAFHLEEYDPITRDLRCQWPGLFWRDIDQYIDNRTVKAVCKSFDIVAKNPAQDRNRTRIVMSDRDARLDVTLAFLALKACVDRGETIQIGLPAQLCGEDIELADALAAVYRPSTSPSRKLVDVQLRTTSFSDMRTRARKNSSFTANFDVNVDGNWHLFSSYSLPISKIDDGSWAVNAAKEASNLSLVRHNNMHIAQFSQKIDVDEAVAERVLRSHAELSFSNLERYRHTGDGNVPDVIAESAMQIDQAALTVEYQ